MNNHANNHRKRFVEMVNKKEKQRIKGRSVKEYSTFAWIGMLGIVGWLVTIPMLLGIALGAWIDRTYPGRYSFTVMFLVAGLAVGCVAAWNWVKQHYTHGNENASGKDNGPQDEGK
jgi:ATP synthase protein I